MLTYLDRCFCSRKDCAVATCHRNQCHVPWDKLPEYMGVALSDFYGKYDHCPDEEEMKRVEDNHAAD